jgi:glycosyltransferase involved in cell wall biosynthesis
MKIGVITEYYPPTFGGVATSAQRIAQNLASCGVRVQVFAFDGSRPLTSMPYVAREEDGHVQVGRVGPFFLGQPSDVRARLTENGRATLRRQVVDSLLDEFAFDPPDVLLSFFLLNAGFVAQLVGAAVERPTVACVRGNDIGHNIFDLGRFAVTEWVVRRSSAIACVNEHLKRKLLWAWPDAAAKTTVIPNSVLIQGDVIDHAPCAARVRREAGWPSSAFVAVFVGTLREKKGAAVLLSALEMLRDRDVRLLVVGPELSADERDLCGRAWDQLKEAGRIFATGRIAQADVAAWVGGSDAVVMPSLDDGMANGVLEGMAVGVCPVVSDVFADLITNDYDGLIIRRGDAVGLANGLRRLVDDLTARARFGAQARVRVAAWSPDMEARAYLKLISRVHADSA